MSIKYLNWAFEQSLKPSPKIVLLALADQANADGISWPAQKTIGIRCSMSRQTINKHVKYLKEQGLLETQESRRQDGKNGSLVYQLIQVKKLDPVNAKLDPEAVNTGLQPITTITEPPLKNTKKDLFKEIDEFEELWKYLKQLLPSNSFHRSSKKISKKRFLQSPEPSDQLASAIKWFYTSDEITQKDYVYAPGLQVVLNNGKYDHFMDKPIFGAGGIADTSPEFAEWSYNAKIANLEGDLPNGSRTPRQCPKELRYLFDAKLWKKFNWGVKP